MDYGRNLQFGFFLTPNAAAYPENLRLTQLCEQLGYDLIGIQDHPYQSRFMDTWTLLCGLAAQTSRIHFFPDVANLPLRPPAMLAKAVATQDRMTPGRITLGLGAGAFWEAIGAMGGPQRTPGQAVDALEEALHVIRLMWSGERGARYRGRYYSLNGVHTGPAPTRALELWIGAYGPRMLDLTGRLGDGWVPSSSYAEPARLKRMQQRIDQAALGAGRSPAAIRRVYNVMGQIGEGPASGAFLSGPVDHWVEQLTLLALDLGIDTFILGLPDPPLAQLERFAAEVAPRVRENVAARRQQAARSSP